MAKTVGAKPLADVIDWLPFAEDFKRRLYHSSAKLDDNKLKEALTNLEEARAGIKGLMDNEKIFNRVLDWETDEGVGADLNELEPAEEKHDVTEAPIPEPRRFQVRPHTPSGKPFPLPDFTMRQLLEAGAHFGHRTQLWNSAMARYIYGERNGIHIIDLTQTVPLLDRALSFVRDTAAKDGTILFVGTKRQASKVVKDAADKCGQFYMNYRWLGGTMTNWSTAAASIGRMKRLEDVLENRASHLPKRQRLSYEREFAKLSASLAGIRDMNRLPDALFVVDVNKEALAVAEAKKLGIPVVAIVDTNCSPAGIDFVIPANDDTSKSIAFFCDLVSRAIISGVSGRLNVAEEDEEFVVWELEDELEAAFEFDAEVVFE